MAPRLYRKCHWRVRWEDGVSAVDGLAEEAEAGGRARVGIARAERESIPPVWGVGLAFG
jgi:hypothetical protein